MTRPCAFCRLPTDNFIIAPDNGEEVPACWWCYHEQERRAVSGYWPEPLLIVPGSAAPFTSTPREVEYDIRARAEHAQRNAAVSLRDVVGAVWGGARLMNDGVTEGEPIADALHAPWATVRGMLGRAVQAGYIERLKGGYRTTRLGDLWLTHGNRGAREQVRGRTR